MHNDSEALDGIAAIVNCLIAVAWLSLTLFVASAIWAGWWLAQALIASV